MPLDALMRLMSPRIAWFPIAALLALASASSAAVSFVPDSLQGPTGQIQLQGSLPGSPATAQVVLSQAGKALDTVALTAGTGGVLQGSTPFKQGIRKPLAGDTLWLKGSGRDTDVIVARLLDGTLLDTLRLGRPALAIALTQRGIKDSLKVTFTGAQSDTGNLRALSFQVDNGTPIRKSTTDSVYRGSISGLLSSSSGGFRNEVTLTATFVDPIYGDTATSFLLVPISPRRIVLQPLGKDTGDTLMGPRGTFALKVLDAWETKDSTAIRLRFVDSTGDTASRTVWLHRSGGSTFTDTLPVTQAASATGDTLVLGRPYPAGSTLDLMAVLPARSVFPPLQASSWIARPKLSLLLGHLFDTNLVQTALKGAFPDAQGKATVQLTCGSLLPNEPRALSLTPGDSLFWLGQVSFKGQVDEWKDSVPLVGRFIDPLYRDTVLDTLKLWAPWYQSRLDIDIRKLSPRERSQANVTLYEHDPDSSRVDTFYVKTPDADSIALVETGRNTGIFWKRIDATELDSTWLHRLPRLTWDVEVKYHDPRHAADSSTVPVALRFDVPFFEMGLRHPVVERAQGAFTTNPGHTFGLEPVMQQDTVFSRDTDPGQGVWVRSWDRTLVTLCLYDNLGVLVNEWSGELEPTDHDNGSLFLLRWDGRASNGRPAPRGIYLLRTYIRRDDGRRAVQQLYHIGLN